MPQTTSKKSPMKIKPEGAQRVLEIGTKRLYTIAHVRQQLDMHSRDVFKEILSLMLGAHPTEQAILAFAQQNPDKWASAVNLMAKLSGYNDTLEVKMNIYATVHTMSDMDLEHQLRDINNKIGDSHLVDPAVITTPYKRVDAEPKAISRMQKSFAKPLVQKQNPKVGSRKWQEEPG